jgi:hypothetical protein
VVPCGQVGISLRSKSRAQPEFAVVDFRSAYFGRVFYGVTADTEFLWATPILQKNGPTQSCSRPDACCLQMAWLLRPFVGSPGAEAQFLRRDASQAQSSELVVCHLIGPFKRTSSKSRTAPRGALEPKPLCSIKPFFKVFAGCAWTSDSCGCGASSRLDKQRASRARSSLVQVPQHNIAFGLSHHTNRGAMEPDGVGICRSA